MASSLSLASRLRSLDHPDEIYDAVPAAAFMCDTLPEEVLVHDAEVCLFAGDEASESKHFRGFWFHGWGSSADHDLPGTHWRTLSRRAAWHGTQHPVRGDGDIGSGGLIRGRLISCAGLCGQSNFLQAFPFGRRLRFRIFEVTSEVSAYVSMVCP